MTAPIWEAKHLVEQNATGYSWDEVINAHLGQGYCISMPDYFICARPVVKGAPECEIIDPNFTFPLEDCDCWHVWIAVGASIPSLWTLMPHRLQWVSYQSLKAHSNRIRYRTINQLERYGKRSIISTGSITNSDSHRG